MSRLVLIDGDVIAYRCLAAATRTAYEIVQPNREVVDFVEPGRIDGKTGPQRAEEIAKQYPGATVSKVSEEPPLENVGHLVSEVLDHASVVYPGPRRIFLSSSQVFRHEIYPEYKGNRPPRPRMLPEVREMLVEGFGPTRPRSASALKRMRLSLFWHDKIHHLLFCRMTRICTKCRDCITTLGRGKK